MSENVYVVEFIYISQTLAITVLKNTSKNRQSIFLSLQSILFFLFSLQVLNWMIHNAKYGVFFCFHLINEPLKVNIP